MTEEVVDTARRERAVGVLGVIVVELAQLSRDRHDRRRGSRRERASAAETHRAFPAAGLLLPPLDLAVPMTTPPHGAVLRSLASRVPSWPIGWGPASPIQGWFRAVARQPDVDDELLRLARRGRWPNGKRVRAARPARPSV